MAVTSNWNDVKQGIINAMSKHKKDFKDKALVDIKNKLEAKNVKVSTNKNSIELNVSSVSEYNNGKVYFDEVFKDINNQSWVDKI